MVNVESCIVRQKLNLLEKIQIYTVHDYKLFDFDLQLYVPGKLVLGHFRQLYLPASSLGFDYHEGKTTLIFNKDNIYYAQAGEEEFEKYTGELDGKKREAVQRIFIPADTIDRIAQQGQAYRTAQQNMLELAAS